MTPAKSLGNLDIANWNRLQEIVERFERDCSTSSPRELAPYLPDVSDPLRKMVLEELVRTDLELRWSKDQGVLIERYMRRFPELRGSDCIPGLLQDEYRLRHQFGDKPLLDEYQARFPEHVAAVRKEADRLAEASHHTPPPGEKGTWIEADRPGQAPSMADEIESAASLESQEATSFSMGGRFKKVRKIGEGGFGEVWEARAPGGVPIAIKRIFASVSPRAIEREKESLDLICSGKLRHPFLLQVFGWWIEDEKLHIAMELADDSLDSRLKEAKKQGRPGLTQEDVKQVVIDCADALDFLNHHHQILHRDVKPANMLLMANRLKLCDFGLTRMTENLALDMGKTMGAGTPVFVAPEIIKGFQSMNSDQYSLAVSYYMLRTGKPLFRGRVAAIRQQHLAADPVFDEAVITAGEEVALKRALSKEPKERFRNCRDFVNELFAAAPAVPKPAPAPPASNRVEPVVIRRKPEPAEPESAPEPVPIPDPASKTWHAPPPPSAAGAAEFATPDTLKIPPTRPVVERVATNFQPEQRHAPTPNHPLPPRVDEELPKTLPVLPRGSEARSESPAPIRPEPPRPIRPEPPARAEVPDRPLAPVPETLESFKTPALPEPAAPADKHRWQRLKGPVKHGMHSHRPAPVVEEDEPRRKGQQELHPLLVPLIMALVVMGLVVVLSLVVGL